MMALILICGVVVVLAYAARAATRPRHDVRRHRDRLAFLPATAAFVVSSGLYFAASGHGPKVEALVAMAAAGLVVGRRADPVAVPAVVEATAAALLFDTTLDLLLALAQH